MQIKLLFGAPCLQECLGTNLISTRAAAPPAFWWGRNPAFFLSGPICEAVPTKQVLGKAGGGGSDGQRCHLRAGPGGPAACAAGRALASAGAELRGSMAQAQERRLGLWSQG